VNKTIKITLLIIGLFSILSGILIYFYKDKDDAFYGVFIGIVLIGSLFLTKNKSKKDELQK